MDIGSRLKEYRLQRGLTQEELASRCELTKGYISQLENDISSPSITTLIDVLGALGITAQQFFAEEKEEKVVFTSSDYFEGEHGDGKLVWLVSNSQKNEMEPIILTLPPEGSSAIRDPFEGEEFGYVLSGRIAIHVGDYTYKAKKGDAFYLTGDKEHQIINIGSTESRILWVTTPSNF